MISASHNPYYDNGIKFSRPRAPSCPMIVEHAIEQGIDQPWSACPRRLGRVKRIEDARGRYIEFCKSTFPNDLDLLSKIVVDCAHGAAYHTAPTCFMNWGRYCDHRRAADA